MDNFKKLIQEKNSAIKEYGDFIKTLKNKECDKDVLGLIGLLKDRLAKFENLSCDNYSQTAADIDELNDRIYRQVNLLANLDKLSRDSDVYKKHNEVYNLKRIKLFISEQICRVKKYYQVLIALLGLIPFIIYFIFWQNVGFFSVAGSESIFSLLSALAISGFGLFIILYIFPALHLVLIVSYDGGEKNETPFYAIYLIATLAGIAFVGAGYFFPRAVDFLNSYFQVIIAAIVISCLLCSLKNGKFDIPLLLFMISHGFLSFATPFTVALLAYVRVSEDGFTTAFLVIFMAFFAVLFRALITSKDIDYFKIFFLVFDNHKFSHRCGYER
jgi:membrane protein